MIKIDENSFLKIKALSTAIDNCLIDVNDSNSNELDNAIILSQMLIEEISKIH